MKNFRFGVTSVCAALTFFAAVSDAHAWKPITHVYLAEEAVDDALDDGHVEIYRVDYDIGEVKEKIGDYAVPPSMLEALRARRAQYRAGVFGPDCYPDILTGAQVIHPNLETPAAEGTVDEDSWLSQLSISVFGANPETEAGPNTNDWLTYLWNVTFGEGAADEDRGSRNRAFVLGFLTHAAGDMFAHTLVNHFSGGEFELGDNAVRHVVLEGYIGKRTPGPASYEVSIGGGVDEFMYRNMVNAVPGSVLEQHLLKGKGTRFSLPRIFSTLRKDLEEEIAASERADLADRLIGIPVRAYKRAWVADIDEGLKEWPVLNHDLAVIIFFDSGDDASKFERAGEKAHEYVNEHLLSMIGFPDFVGGAEAVAESIVEAILPRELVRQIRDTFLNELFQYAFGINYDELKEYFQHSERSFDIVLNRGAPGASDNAPHPVSLQQFNAEQLRIQDTGYANPSEYFDWRRFPPAYNTVTMTKLLLLSQSEVNRLLEDLGASSRLEEPNIMLGFIKTLDGDNQWKKNDNKMVFAREPSVYRQIFMSQTGEEPRLESEAPASPEEGAAEGTAAPDISTPAEPRPAAGGAAGAQPPKEKPKTGSERRGDAARGAGAGPTGGGVPPVGGAVGSGGAATVPSPRPAPTSPAAPAPSPRQARQPLPATIDADELIEVCEGQTRSAHFKTDVMNVRLASGNPGIASVELKENTRVEITGHHIGETLITVHASVIRYQAGANVPLRADQPFESTVRVLVTDCAQRSLGDIYERTHSTLARVDRELGVIRQRALSEIVGKEQHDDSGYFTLTEQQINNTWFESVFARMEDFKRTLEEDKAAYETNQLGLTEFYKRCYEKANRAIQELWRTYLREAGSENGGWVPLLSAEILRANERLYTEERTEGKRLAAQFGYGTKEYHAGLAELKERQSQTKREIFYSVAERYRMVKDRLGDARSRWGSEMWNWQNFASSKGNEDSRVHTRAASDFRRDLYKLFDVGGRSDSALDFFMNSPGSPDRLITGYGEYEWCQSRPFPDLQLHRTSLGLLRMKDLGSTRVEALRRSSAENSGTGLGIPGTATE